MNNTKTLDSMFQKYIKMFPQNITINGIESTGFFNEIENNMQTMSTPDFKNLYIKSGSVKQGDLVTALNENWLVSSDIVTYNEVYDKARVQRCNSFIAFNFAGNVVFLPSVVIGNKFDISVKDEANVLNGGLTITLQSNKDSRNIFIDQRILFKGQAFQVSGKDKTSIGLISLTCRLTEIDTVHDDMENSIANRWRYESIYELDVVNGNSINMGLNEETQLILRVWDKNKITQQRSEVVNPVLFYTVDDETIINVTESGKITSIKEGTTQISVSFKSINALGEEEIVCTNVNVTVENTAIIEHTVDITGNPTIFFDGKSKYTAKLLENGVQVDDSFTFKIVIHATGAVVPIKTAKLINVTTTTCEVQAYDYNAIIRLIATSVSTEFEGTKVITIRDIL